MNTQDQIQAPGRRHFMSQASLAAAGVAAGVASSLVPGARAATGSSKGEGHGGQLAGKTALITGAARGAGAPWPRRSPGKAHGWPCSMSQTRMPTRPPADTASPIDPNWRRRWSPSRRSGASPSRSSPTSAMGPRWRRVTRRSQMHSADSTSPSPMPDTWPGIRSKKARRPSGAKCSTRTSSASSTPSSMPSRSFESVEEGA